MTHIREHRSVLAAAEKRLLIWIAERLPASLTSDHLSGLALLSMVAGGVAFAAIGIRGWSPALFVLALAANWFGDSLDGTVARVRDQQRPRYGYYVDHVIDLAGTMALVGGMAVSGLMHPTIALALLASYFTVAAETYLATVSTATFRISFAGVGPTELRILLAIGAIVAAVDPWVDIFGRTFLLFDVGGVVAAGGLCGVFIVSALRNGLALYAAEPMPHQPAMSAAPAAALASVRES
jgi:phosphatidylglycerophosphate synthase